MHSPIYVAILVFFLAEAAAAGTIRCNGQVIEDDTVDPVMLSEVLEKCGEPRSREGSVLIYDQPGDMQGVLRFNDSYELERLEVERRQ